MADNRYGRDEDWRGMRQPFGQEQHGDQHRNRGFGGYDDGRSFERDGRGSFGPHHGYDADRRDGADHENQRGGFGAYWRDPSAERGNQPNSVASAQRDLRQLGEQVPPAAFRDEGRNNDRFNNRDENRHIAIDETNQLIASNKVEGTRVYNRRGERLGTIENFMVGKRSGKVEYAVMSFGGFLGLGERYFPLPWDILRYDEHLGGYQINVDGDERALRHAPSFRAGEEPRWDRSFGQHVYGFYGLTY